MSIKEGANYSPESELAAVVAADEFCIAAAFLHHSHIYDQINGLISVGATRCLSTIRTPARIEAFAERCPDVHRAASCDEILNDKCI